MRQSTTRRPPTEVEAWPQRWWDWTITTTFCYFIGFVFFSLFQATYLDALLTTSTLLPVVAMAVGLMFRAIPFGFRAVFIGLLSFIGPGMRFFLFPEQWFRMYWVMAAAIAWITFALIAFDAGPVGSQKTWRSVVTILCPLVPSILLLYFLATS
jgi:hypothetical protein